MHRWFAPPLNSSALDLSPHLSSPSPPPSFCLATPPSVCLACTIFTRITKSSWPLSAFVAFVGVCRPFSDVHTPASPLHARAHTHTRACAFVRLLRAPVPRRALLYFVTSGFRYWPLPCRPWGARVWGDRVSGGRYLVVNKLKNTPVTRPQVLAWAANSV